MICQAQTILLEHLESQNSSTLPQENPVFSTSQQNQNQNVGVRTFIQDFLKRMYQKKAQLQQVTVSLDLMVLL